MSQKSPVQNPRNETDENEMAAFAAVPMNDELIGVESLRGQLTRLMYGPQPQLPEEPIESSLPFIPWKIRMVEDQPNRSNNTTDNHTKTSSETTTSSHNEANDDTNSLVSFPTFSYLDLRRIQNLSFADTQAVKAQQELDDGNIAEARAAWKRALELVPNHVPCLVGYGRFLLATGKLDMAEKIFNKALASDPNHDQTQAFRSELMGAHHQRFQHRPYSNPTNLSNIGDTKKKNFIPRENAAYQNALLERQLLASPPKDHATVDEDEAEAPSDSDTSSSYERIRRKRKKKERHRRRMKRKRHRAKRKERRKHKKRRRHHDSSDKDACSDSSSKDNSMSPKSVLSDASSRSRLSRKRSQREASMLAEERGKESGSSGEESIVSRHRRKERQKRKSCDKGSRRRSKKESPPRRRRHYKKQSRRSRANSTSS